MMMRRIAAAALVGSSAAGGALATAPAAQAHIPSGNYTYTAHTKSGSDDYPASIQGRVIRIFFAKGDTQFGRLRMVRDGADLPGPHGIIKFRRISPGVFTGPGYTFGAYMGRYTLTRR